MFQIVDKIFLKKYSTASKFNHKEFSELKTNFDRFRYVWNYDNNLLDKEYSEFIDEKIGELKSNAEVKDLERGEKSREEGNAFYKKSALGDALLKYNVSLKYSPLADKLSENNNNLALTYSNRSAVFMGFKRYELAIEDIDQALKHNYPANMRNKLIDRKVDCLLKLKRHEDAVKLLSGILGNKRSGYSEEILAGFQKKLTTIETEMNEAKLQQLDLTPPVDTNANKHQQQSSLLNDNISVKAAYSEECGNYIQSKKNIEIGTEVLIEAPYASVLIKEYIATNCYNCMKRLNPYEMNITYCKYCVHVSYCNEACCQESWSSNHSIECQYFKLIVYRFGISHMEHLGLRIILKTNFDCLKSLQNELIGFEKEYEASEQNSKQLVIDSDKPYDSRDYKNIFNLITHSNKRISMDLVRRSMVAGLFAKLLLRTAYFPQKYHVNEKSDEFFFIGALILRHLQSISCNAHEISELQYNTHSLATSVTTGIGAGIYAILSLFNHSCDPHVTRNFNGTSCVLRSIKCIKEGQQMFDNYGKLYAVNDFDDRQFKLQDQYFFTCKCEPCESKWPAYDKINDDMNKLVYHCDICLRSTVELAEDPRDCCFDFMDKLKFIKNRVEKDTKYCKKALKEILQAKSEDKLDIQDILVKFVRYLTIIDIYVHNKPYQEFNNCQEAMKQCFNLMGNKHVFTKLETFDQVD